MRPKTVTVTDATTSAWIPVDYTQNAFSLGIQVDVVSGTPTWVVQCTMDDIFNSAVTPTAIAAPSPLETGTTDEIGAITIPCRAVRLSQSGTGVSKFTVIQGRK
jgi:hypothetical protein